MENQIIPLAPLLATLGIMLSISVMVERFLMILNWLIDRLQLAVASVSQDVSSPFKQQFELAVRAKAEAELLREPPASEDETARAEEVETNPDYAAAEFKYYDIKPFYPADSRARVKEFWLQLFGLFVAIAGCYYAGFSAWTLVDWLKEWAGIETAAEPSLLWGVIFTGIIIGAGSKPVHFLMNFLLNRKLIQARETVKRVSFPPEEKSTPPQGEDRYPQPETTPQSGTELEKRLGFLYDGGYRPERLENTHQRKEKISLVVYHHTAMHADSPFDEVVKVFERKGWLTGYHCVVLKDGTIRIFCPWDKIGNHVRGYNARSLGIALHGNFEPNPAVPGANVDGKYGILHPTPEQLDAAARIVALWTIMYDLKIDFEKTILPHRKLSPKACPGSNFPYDLFAGRIEMYENRWKKDADMLLKIEEFKRFYRL